MASLLSGIELLEDWGVYSTIIPFILIVAASYGILSHLKPFGDNDAVNVIISLMFGFMFISARSAVRFVSMFIPYVMVLFVVVMLMLVIFRFIGADEGMITEALRANAGWGSVIGVLVVGIFVFIGLSFPELTPSMQPEVAGSTGSSNGNGNDISVSQDILRDTIFHPTIVGIIVMIIVFSAATYMITSKEKR